MSEIKININRAQIGQNRALVNKKILIELLNRDKSCPTEENAQRSDLPVASSSHDNLKIVIFEDVSKFALYRLYKVSKKELKRKNYKKELGLRREIDTGTEVGKWVKYWKKVDCDGPGFIAQYESPPSQKKVAVVIIDTEGSVGNLLINADEITNLYAIDSQPGSYYIMFRTIEREGNRDLQNNNTANSSTFCLWSNDIDNAKKTFHILDFYVKDHARRASSSGGGGGGGGGSSSSNSSISISITNSNTQSNNKNKNNNANAYSDDEDIFGGINSSKALSPLGNSAGLVRFDSLGSSGGGVNELDQITALLDAVSPFSKNKNTQPSSSKEKEEEEDGFARLTFNSSNDRSKISQNSINANSTSNVNSNVNSNSNSNANNSMSRGISIFSHAPPQTQFQSQPNIVSLAELRSTINSSSLSISNPSPLSPPPPSPPPGINITHSVNSIYYSTNPSPQPTAQATSINKVPPVAVTEAVEATPKSSVSSTSSNFVGNSNSNSNNNSNSNSNSKNGSISQDILDLIKESSSSSSAAVTASSGPQTSSQPLRKPSMKPSSLLKKK